MLTELLQLALRNLMRARLRLVMTSAGVLVGTAAVILLVALTIGLQTIAEAGIGNSATLTEITVMPSREAYETSGNTYPTLNDDDLEALKAISGVRSVTPISYFDGGTTLYSDKLQNYVTIFGIDPSNLGNFDLPLQSGELMLDSETILVGSDVPLYFIDPKATEWLPVEVDINTAPLSLVIQRFTDSETRRIRLNVAGWLKQQSGRFDNAILFPLDTVLQWNAWAAGKRYNPDDRRFGQVIIRTMGRESTRDVLKGVQELGYQTDGIGDFLDSINAFFSSMRLILGAVGGVALVAASFGVANTMTMAIMERTSEIGIMKAIGAKNRDVLVIFLFEAGLVGFVGGLAGVLTSLFIGNMVNQALLNADVSQGIQFLPINVSTITSELIIIPTDLILFGLALATSVGLLAGLFPAFRAARMSPVDALKYE